MNILYAGSNGTSGYAIATKNSIFNLLMNGHNVTFHPIQVDNSLQQQDIISIEVEKCIYKKYDIYDKLIIELVPQELTIIKIHELFKVCNNLDCKKIIKTVWETTHISPSWLSVLNNDIVDEIWVPSKFNKIAFENSGVTKPIFIDKYVSFNYLTSTIKQEIDIPNNIQYGNKDIKNTYNFYYISTWNERKNNYNTIKTFCETFTNNDNVSLLMKTGYNDYNDNITSIIKHNIESILLNFPNHPNIVYFPDNYTHSELNNIHLLGDCYFLLHRGEGLGISSYDSYLNHKPVIVTGYGGHVEYFTENYPYFVNYSMIDVNTDIVPFDCYKHLHKWAEPDYDHAKQLLLDIYNQKK
jgi:hypothetical protein